MAATNVHGIILRHSALLELYTGGTLSPKIIARINDTCVAPYFSDIKNNVHRDGIEKDYSTKEMWATADDFYKKGLFRTVGKNGTKTKKTIYIADGYKGLRDKQGFKTDKVYLEVSGDMKNSFRLAVEGNSSVMGLNDKSQSEKYNGLVKRYGEFYQGTKENRQSLFKRIIAEIALIQKEVLSGN